MYKVNIRPILNGPETWMRLQESEKFALEGVKLLAPVSMNLKLTNASSRIIVQGRLDTTVELVCSRCLEPFAAPLRVDVQEEYLPHTGEEAAMRAAEMAGDFFTYDEAWLDLEEAVRQNVGAAAPIQPLCKEDCQGLCPECGVNRNTTECTCQTTRSDPRWSGLSKFLKTE